MGGLGLLTTNFSSSSSVSLTLSRVTSTSAPPFISASISSTFPSTPTLSTAAAGYSDAVGSSNGAVDFVIRQCKKLHQLRQCSCMFFVFCSFFFSFGVTALIITLYHGHFHSSVNFHIDTFLVWIHIAHLSPSPHGIVQCRGTPVVLYVLGQMLDIH